MAEYNSPLEYLAAQQKRLGQRMDALEDECRVERDRVDVLEVRLGNLQSALQRFQAYVGAQDSGADLDDWMDSTPLPWHWRDGSE